MSWGHRILASTVFFCLVLVLNLGRGPVVAAGSNSTLSQMERVVRVGVIVDSNSTLGNMALSYIDAALSDFYEVHPTHRTRLSLHYRNPGSDVIAAASAGIELIIRSVPLCIYNFLTISFVSLQKQNFHSLGLDGE